MNIWLICQYYKPEPGAPSARLSGFAKMWKKDMQNVTVLTAVPNHPDGVIKQGYKNAHMVEEVEGTLVIRHPLYVTANSGFIKKVLSHISFAMSVFFRNLSLRSRPKPDVIIASSPSFFAAISAWLLSVRYRVPFVMEVRDLWPGIFVELGVMRKGIILSILEWVELFLYRRAAKVVTVTRGFAEDMVKRGIPQEKLIIITNGVSDDEIDIATKPATDGSVDKLRNELQLHPLVKVVLYIGAHGTSQALGQVIDVARMMMSQTEVLFMFVGDGADKARLQKSAKGMPNVQFIDSQNKEKVWQFYNLAYIGLVPLKDTPGFSTFIPSKMFEIMASKTPCIGCVRGEAAQIMEQSGGALVVPPEDPEKLADAIKTLIDSDEKAQEMGEAGQKFVSTHFRHSTLAKRYLDALLKAAGKQA
jgi:glycosyltransferase involved in cell wall biosynthesis